MQIAIWEPLICLPNLVSLVFYLSLGKLVANLLSVSWLQSSVPAHLMWLQLRLQSAHNYCIDCTQVTWQVATAQVWYLDKLSHSFLLLDVRLLNMTRNIWRRSFKQDSITPKDPCPHTAFSVPKRNKKLVVWRRRRKCPSEDSCYYKGHG